MKKATVVFAAVIASCVIALPSASMATGTDSPIAQHMIGDVSVRTEKPIKSQAELDDYLVSSIPKTVAVDMDTGEIASVVEDSVLQSKP